MGQEYRQNTRIAKFHGPLYSVAWGGAMINGGREQGICRELDVQCYKDARSATWGTLVSAVWESSGIVRGGGADE